MSNDMEKLTLATILQWCERVNNPENRVTFVRSASESESVNQIPLFGRLLPNGEQFLANLQKHPEIGFHTGKE